MRSKYIRTSASFPVSTARLLRALSEPAEIRRWSGQKGKIPLRVGGRMSLYDGWVQGRITAYRPGRQLDFSWKPVEWGAGAELSTVRCSFARTSSGTRMTIVHTGFPTAKEASAHRSGWKVHVFDPLKDYLKASRKS